MDDQEDGKRLRVMCKVCGLKEAANNARREFCRSCYTKHIRRLKAYGRWEGRIDAQPTREKINELYQAGFKYGRIAELAGVHRSTIADIVTKNATIYPHTARKIAAIPIPVSNVDELHHDGSKVPSLGSVRRLRALVADGHQQGWLAKELGMNFRYLNLMLLNGGKSKGQGKSDQLILAKNARKIDELFRRLELTPGKSKYSRSLGEKYGWPRPLYWDHETIDDSRAQPAMKRMKTTDGNCRNAT